MKSGYRQTKVGVIPDEWNHRNVRDIASSARNAIVGGPFGSDLVSADYAEDGVPVIRGQNMGSKWVSGTFVFVTNQKAKSLEANLARPGDIVFTQRGTLGQVSLVPEKPFPFYLVSQSQMKVTLGREIADPLFFFYVFTSEQQQKFIRSGTIQTGVPHINLSILREIPVQLPPLCEQRAIAEALGDVDALLAVLDRIIAKKHSLKQAAVQQLLTGRARLPGFYGAWKAKTLAEICSMKSGEGITTANIDSFSKYPCYGGNGLRGFTTCFTHEGTYGLIGRQGALCGNVLGVEGAFFASEHAIVVTARPQNDIRWLTCVLRRMNLNQYSESSAQPGLSVAKLLLLETETPPSKAEQTAIAEVLSEMDAELIGLEQRREKTHALKRGMMQELLTGKTRLISASESHA